MPDSFAVIDIKLDYMRRLVFADQNQNVKILQDRFIEVIQSNIVGGFGKCLKLNPSKDLVYCVRENFSVAVIDLTSSKYNVKEVMEVQEDIELLADWTIDHKSGLIYFLMNTGLIVGIDTLKKSKFVVKIEEKIFSTLSKEDKLFTAISLNPSGRFLSVSGVVKLKDKKTNSILLYKVENDSKGELRLSVVSQVSTENSWEGGKLISKSKTRTS